MRKKLIGNIIFNLAETALIFTIGRLLSVPVNVILIIMLLFFSTRLVCGQPKHYNKWYRCCVWSCLVFTSLYLVSNIDIYATTLLAIFTALISSGKADVNDIYMWKGTESKYQDILDYIKYNPLADDILEFEDKLKKSDNITYMLYKYRFKDLKSFSEISELLDIETNRITEYLDKIAFTMRLYCKI